MIRPLLYVAALILLSMNIMAQGTIYVRSGGSDSNDGASESQAKKTIQSAIAAAQAGDIVDVGPGAFAGAAIDKGLVIQGSNANYDLARWDTPTLISSTFTLGSSAQGATVTFVGLQFGQITPLEGKADNANVTVYNCKFFGSKPIVTAGTKWAELFFTASLLDGRTEGAKPNTPMATTAISTGDVAVVVVRENVIRNYAKSAIEVQGASQVVRLSYNEYSNCNAGADPSHAAVKIDAASIEQEVTVENSLFTSCPTSVSVAGATSGKTVVIQRNSFRQIPAKGVAIRNTSSSPVNASCNAFNVATKEQEKPLSGSVIAASVRKLVAGQVIASPTNLDGKDIHGDAIGYEPDPEKVCAETLPE